jgi:hypothetical protein
LQGVFQSSLSVIRPSIACTFRLAPRLSDNTIVGLNHCVCYGATLITSNLPFDEWTETFGTERLTGALLDRLTHHVNILEMNGESYRLAQSQARKATKTS